MSRLRVAAIALPFLALWIAFLAIAPRTPVHLKPVNLKEIDNDCTAPRR